MSKTKSGGSARNLKDSPGQRLGVKRYGGQSVSTGAVLVRQRGLSKVAGPGTAVGKDYTIYATREGKVAFKKTQVTRFSGKKVPRTQVRVEP
jgi:large subunit ribosomal protein L27